LKIRSSEALKTIYLIAAAAAPGHSIYISTVRQNDHSSDLWSFTGLAFFLSLMLSISTVTEKAMAK